MNGKQRAILLLGVLLIAATGLVPPWVLLETDTGHPFVSTVYQWLFVPPHYLEKIDATNRDVSRYLKAVENLRKSEYNSDRWCYKPGSFTIVNEFEDKHGAYRSDGKLQKHGGRWWHVHSWENIAPRLDTSRLYAQWALIILVTVGLVLVFQDRRK